MTGPDLDPLGDESTILERINTFLRQHRQCSERYAALLQDLNAFIADCERLAQPSPSSDDTPEQIIENRAQEAIYGRLARRLIALLDPYLSSQKETR